MVFDTIFQPGLRTARTTLLVLGLVLLARQSTAQEAEPADTERPVVAVFQISTDGLKLTSEALGRLTRYLKSRLVINKKYQTLPDSSMIDAMAALKIESYKDCKDESCQIELGKEASAQMSLSVEVWKIEGACEIIGNLTDLRTATTLISATVSNIKCTERPLMGGLERLADQLSGKASAESITAHSMPATVAQPNSPQPQVAIPAATITDRQADAEVADKHSYPTRRTQILNVPEHKPWAVICGSIPQEGSSSRQQAERIADRLRSTGIDASVYDGRRFSKFRCCFWSVIAGFFASRSDAAELVNQIRAKGFDVYSKKAF